MAHLVFDLGGTWLKAAAFAADEFPSFVASPAALAARVRRRSSPSEPDGLARAMRQLAGEVAEGGTVQSAVVSTAGILHPSGRHLTACAEHLSFLRCPEWIADLEKTLSAPVRLINDAEAFLLGAAETGLVPRTGTLCALVIGTGLGCAVSKDARHWRPQGRPSLLGSIRCGGGSTYDSLASASRLAAHSTRGDLLEVLTAPAFADVRTAYFSTLSEILATAGILHDADEILIGGGLADARRDADIDLASEIRNHWGTVPPETGRRPTLRIAPYGNALTLLGAGALALSLSLPRDRANFGELATEQSHPASRNLHRESARKILNHLWQAETEAGAAQESSLDALAELTEHIVTQWESGGRILYVGAGTSGRIAALDAVEIPCTFGCPPDRVVAVVAGGLIESALRIESEGEEDFSAAPDLILLQPGPHDTVVGISASGSAAYVRTALTYARSRGAHTVLVTATPQPGPWDGTIPLASGCEIIAGSTRMKAGTATKKVLNFLSTTVMARLGKLRGPHMIDMTCLNAKLEHRAIRILRDLFPLSETQAKTLLEQNHYNLRHSIETVECL